MTNLTPALIADPAIYRCEIGDCPEMAATFTADQIPVCVACSTVSAGTAVDADDIRLEQMVTLGSVHSDIDEAYVDAQTEDAQRRSEPQVILRWRGRTRSGAEWQGVIPVDRLVAFVEAKYAAGWKQLAVTHDGDEVGGIGDYVTGKRQCWYDQPRVSAAS